ncbi:MAG: LPS export ABC transporter periplasmic protein LptC [Pseudomonadota bacterium]
MSVRRGVLNTLGMALLAIAVFYSLRYWPQRLPLLPTDLAAPASQEPDYRITDFHAIDLDETGRLRYELTATHLVHYPNPERADLTAPEMVFYRNGHPEDANVAAQLPPDPWQLTARRGRIADGGERLDLEGGVKVARVSAGTGDTVQADAIRMTLESERLTVFGRQEVATTDSPVRLSSDRAELTGVGMQIDLKKGQMHLLSQVKGHYVPR